VKRIPYPINSAASRHFPLHKFAANNPDFDPFENVLQFHSSKL
jgi:hypothetical protein